MTDNIQDLAELEISERIREDSFPAPRVRILQISSSDQGLSALGSDNNVYVFHSGTWYKLPPIENTVELTEETYTSN